MIEVREATPDDAGRILEIYAYYIEHTAITFEYDVPMLADFTERIRHTLQRYPYLVILQERVVMGYAYAGPLKGRAAYDWSCELSIYLEHGAHGLGLGRALYEKMEEVLKGMGIRNLYACIAVPEIDDAYLTGNSAAFHAHMGFREIGKFENCANKFGRWYHMIWMEKIIGDHEGDPEAIIPYSCIS